MAAKVPAQAVREFAAKLDGVQGRTRAALKREFAAGYGISPASLSRALHEVGVRCHTRCDVGSRRKVVTDEVLGQIAAIQRASLSLRKGVVMPAEDAINIAEDSGLVERGGVSASYYNGWLRDNEASRRDQLKPEPHTDLRSLGPNHVHQVDFSLAVNWKVFQGKPQYEHLIYKNKLPSAGAPRLYRLIVVDHASGSFFPHYTCSTGETVQALLEGLYHAWSEKRIAGKSVQHLYPFRGVPRILMADRGSANQAGITASLMERLGVSLNICEGARSKGAVEVSHNWWEQHFEARLRLQRPESVEQLNEWAVDFAARQCAAAVHTRHRATRSNLWAWHINRREETQLRELRADFNTFRGICVTDPTSCLVHGNRLVRFKSKRYRLPEEFLPGEHVAVQYSPFQYPEILVRHERPGSAAWLCEPVEIDEFGFVADAPVIGAEYKSQRKTETAKFVDAAEAAASEFVAGQQLRVFGHHREALDPIEIRHSGADVLEPTAAPAYMSRVQARQAVLESLGRPFTPVEVAFLNRSFPDQVTEAQVAEAVGFIQQGIRAEVVALGGAH